LLALQVLFLPGIHYKPSADQELGALTKDLAIEELQYKLSGSADSLHLPYGLFRDSFCVLLTKI
jgi:hypothetical protein